MLHFWLSRWRKWPPAKTCSQLLEGKKAKKCFLPWSLHKESALRTPGIQPHQTEFRLSSELKITHFCCCSKPLNLWSFVTVVLGNKYSYSACKLRNLNRIINIKSNFSNNWNSKYSSTQYMLEIILRASHKYLMQSSLQPYI